MGWLNYHHLLYFWTVARTGSIAAAGAELHVSQPTISAQIKELEQSVGHALFQRQGRGLVLTDAGRTAYRYADEIFRLGKELQSAMEGRPVGQRMRFAVGVAQVIPKLVAERLLHPVLQAVESLALECREAGLPQLLAQLAVHDLDVVISDAPAPPDMRVKAYNHLLGETGTTFFAGAKVAAGLRKNFPKSLHGAPALLPSRGSQVRSQLEGWFEKQGVQPEVVGEFDDNALMTVFGAGGLGFFVAPTAIAGYVERLYDVTAVGQTDEIRERFYAISVERKLRHPAVAAMAESARAELFAP